MKVLWFRFQKCLGPLTCWLPNGVLKQELSGIQITTYFGVTNFRKNKAMELIFSSKMHNILCRFFKFNNSFRKVVLVLKIIAFELVTGISLKSDEKRCDRPSRWWNTVLRFQIWLRRMCFNSDSLRLQEN